MSLIDDFLMNEVIGNEEHGIEVIDYILQVVLGQKIEIDNVQVQRIQTAGDNEKRGIRLDIRTKISLYQILIFSDLPSDSVILPDNKATVGIEVHNTKSETQSREKFDIRRRSRLYQSILDVNMLNTGDDFGDLDDVIIIVCTSFDVFGRDRYKYTFTNICHEESDLLLDDGAYRIFLNTKGKTGGSTELKELLNYTESSDIRNATNEKLMKLHAIVSKVKNSKEARERYMWESEKLERARDEGREEAKAEITELKAKNADIKAENAEIKAENTEIKAENAEIKTALTKIMAELATLKEQMISNK